MKQRKIYRESTMEWMKPRIRLMIWNIRKKKKHSIRTAREKKERIQKARIG